MNAQGSRKQYDHLIKLIIIGDSSVGKSCILLRFSEDHFPQSHMPTIGKCPIRPPARTRASWGGPHDRKSAGFVLADKIRRKYPLREQRAKKSLSGSLGPKLPPKLQICTFKVTSQVSSKESKVASQHLPEPSTGIELHTNES